MEWWERKERQERTKAKQSKAELIVLLKMLKWLVIQSMCEWWEMMSKSYKQLCFEHGYHQIIYAWALLIQAAESLLLFSFYVLSQSQLIQPSHLHLYISISTSPSSSASSSSFSSSSIFSSTFPKNPRFFQSISPSLLWPTGLTCLCRSNMRRSGVIAGL